VPAPLDRYVATFVASLAAAGVRHAVIAPGSRNTPLTLALTHPSSGIHPWLHLDERSAAYFALGIARQLGEPVAVLCTSGTAAANLLPAAVEARLSRVPLLLLTADRPPELRDAGAPQTIDQVALFGSHAKWAVDMPLPDGDPQLDRYASTTAARAAAVALESPAGPVHLNFPFREPLVDAATFVDPPPALAGIPAAIEVTRGARLVPDRAEVEQLAAALAGRRGIIVAGPESLGLPAVPLVALADALGWPLVADPLSGLRAGDHDLTRVVERADALAREPEFTARAAPEVVLRFGAAPTSKPLNLWLASIEGLRHFIVDDASLATAGLRDPDALPGAIVRSDPALLCAALASALGAHEPAPPDWCDLWLAANTAASDALDAAIAGLDEPFEGRAPVELAAALPAGATLVVGNSMPVRDVDSFLPKLDRPLRIVGTRGASGIDGVLSTAAGAAAVSEGPVALLVGDLSFFHDQNGLWPVARHGLDLTVLLVNNDGGGIFEFLPQRDLVGDRFDPWWGTPHGLDFTHAVAQYDGRHALIEGSAAAQLESALATPGLDVLELRTDRGRNLELHRAVFDRAREAVRARLRAVPATTSA
jgi:2-succinyl-5-enolpyruvyl-6-hydroxy-3-cyclohexene-1-carboxylate synthase